MSYTEILTARIADMERQLNAAHEREAERYQQCAEQRQRTELAEHENAKLRFLISEVVETQNVTDACRDDLRSALKS